MSGIRLFEPDFDRVTEQAVIKTLRSGFWDQGRKVEEFEEALRKYLGCKHVVAVSSGTAALHLVLSLFPQKNVLVPALSFVSTALAGLYNGKKVRFEDVDREKLNMLYFSLDEDTINIPVHFGGMPINVQGDDDEVNVIEDCAHAMGSKLTTKNIKCFSFHPVKNLAMPNGGAIALYDDLYYDELIQKRWCGISQKFKDNRDVVCLGWNYKLNDVNAVIGIEQLKKLDKNNEKRFKIAKEYTTRLNESQMPLSKKCSYCLYWILVKDRDKFRAKLTKEGIETGTHYPPIDQFSFFKEVDLPVTHAVSKQIVTLPIHPNLSDQDVDRVISCANS